VTNNLLHPEKTKLIHIQIKIILKRVSFSSPFLSALLKLKKWPRTFLLHIKKHQYTQKSTEPSSANNVTTTWDLPRSLHYNR